jgi:hyperosmotically inducible periplasmic protein
MNRKLIASGLIVMATLVAPAVFGQDSDADRTHPKAFVKDSVITTKIKSKLAADHPGTLAQIRVDTDKDGVVWLSGTAPTREAAQQAADIARSTKGVVSVRDEIKVRRGD